MTTKFNRDGEVVEMVEWFRRPDRITETTEELRNNRSLEQLAQAGVVHHAYAFRLFSVLRQSATHNGRGVWLTSPRIGEVPGRYFIGGVVLENTALFRGQGGGTIRSERSRIVQTRDYAQMEMTPDDVNIPIDPEGDDGIEPDRGSERTIIS